MGKLKNKKREIFCREVLKSKGNISKAYKEVYNTKHPDAIRANSSHLFKAPEVQQRIDELLNQSGLSVEELNSKLQLLTEAEKSIVVDGKIKEVKDCPTQLAALRTAYQLRKMLGNEGQQAGQQVNIHIYSPEEVSNIGKVISELKKLNENMGNEYSPTGEVIDGEVVE